MWSNSAPPAPHNQQAGETSYLIDEHNWRARAIAIVRIAFGLLWAFAAWWKWQPAFQNTFASQIAKAAPGQPAVIQSWIALWVRLVNTNPLLFARIEASLETALAICLILGLLSNLACVLGILLSLGIWSTAEGFGGPFQAGVTTDIGTTPPYALLFGALLVVSAGLYYGVDRWLTPRLGPLGILASGFPARSTPQRELAI